MMMKILDPSNRHHVCELHAGDTFKCDGHYWMMSDCINDTIKCMCLENGHLATFKDSDNVTPIEMEAIVK